jgi:ribA/ribD-fused uncharacterized protein
MIKFYKTREAYGCFSNFSRHPVSVNGIVWHTSEHYFQAQKLIYPSDQDEIRINPSPRNAADIGRSRPMRKDWDLVKDYVMAYIVLEKFVQNEEIREVLLSTGEQEIVEHTENDSYWCDGGDGTGQNMLGRILMGVRTHLREKL